MIYSASKDQDLGDAVFQVADQINHGIDSSMIQPEMREYANLFFAAGSRAVAMSDYDMARSYLENASKLLPSDHWSSHYEMSLRLQFLRAKTAYSSGKSEVANDMLKVIFRKGLCLVDKLDAYYLQATVSK